MNCSSHTDINSIWRGRFMPSLCSTSVLNFLCIALNQAKFTFLAFLARVWGSSRESQAELVECGLEPSAFKLAKPASRFLQQLRLLRTPLLLGCMSKCAWERGLEFLCCLGFAESMGHSLPTIHPQNTLPTVGGLVSWHAFSSCQLGLPYMAS